MHNGERIKIERMPDIFNVFIYDYFTFYLARFITNQLKIVKIII